jgi:shikimate kinase
MKVFIVGFMGSGKTTYGRELAKLTNLDFFDLDQEIEKNCQLSIPQIFSDFGESFFREKESETLDNVLKKDNIVIATGGGTVVFNNNMLKMNKAGITLFLKLNCNTLYKRVYQNQDSRPLLKGKNPETLRSYIFTEYRKRMVYYRQAMLHN